MPLSQFAEEFLNGFSKLGKKHDDLSRFKRLMKILGNPQDNLKFIHIAGTNGKGSVTRMCSQILIYAGYKVGEFTSPYILEYNDRIKINNQNIPEEKLDELIHFIKERTSISSQDKVLLSDFSQFEISTAIAFLYFNHENCDIVALEVGLGGLLDSTNIITTTCVSVITSISEDHTSILGDTIREIALQKSGIIKNKCPVVISKQKYDDAYMAIKGIAYINKSPLIEIDVEKVKVLDISINGSEFLYKGIKYKLKLIGLHQISNALTAIEVINVLNDAGFYAKDEHIKRGLYSANLHGRTEIISNKPLTILDGGHNVDGVRALLKTLEFIPLNSKKIFVVGFSTDKNVEKCVELLAREGDVFICIDGFSNNTYNGNNLKNLFKLYGKKSIYCSNLTTACNNVSDYASDDDTVIICGSLYLVASCRKHFDNL